MQIQQFEANESVAACFDVVCNEWKKKTRNNTSAYDKAYSVGYCIEKSIWHSKDACGVLGNHVWQKDASGEKLYEQSKVHGRLECTITAVDYNTGAIEWTNADGDQEWHHVGVMNLQDESRPNHS